MWQSLFISRMGRLMDSIQAALGLKPSDRVLINYGGEPASKSSKDAVPHYRKGAPTEQLDEETVCECENAAEVADSAAYASNVGGGAEHTSRVKETDNAAPGEGYAGIPQASAGAKKNCVECKIVGTVTMCALALWGIKLGVRDNPMKLKGWRFTVYRIQMFSLATALFALAFERVNDRGIFDEANEGKSFSEIYNKDITYLAGFIGKEPPSYLKMKEPPKEEESELSS